MRIIIEGAGEVGTHLAKMLRREGNEICIIDNDKKRIANINQCVDVEIVEGPLSSISSLKQAQVDKADLFIAVVPFASQEINILGAILAKKLGCSKVMARINDEDYLTPENKLLFKEMGIELLFYPERSAADEILAFLKHNSTADATEFANGKLQIGVFKIDEDSPIIDIKLSEFIKNIPAEDLKQFRIIAISREDKTIIPKLNTKFLLGDLVFTISRKEGLEALNQYFGKSNIEIRNAFILGGSKIAEMLAASLSKLGIAVKIVDSDKERCIEMSEALPDDVLVSCGNGRNSDFLFEEGLQNYDAFIALSQSDESNVLSCVIARKLGVPRVVAEVENIEYIHLAEEMGIDSVINKKLLTAGKIFRLTLSGKARFVRYMAGTNTEVMEYIVSPGSAITKAPLKNIDFPPSAIVGGIVRGNEGFIAVGDTQIEPYDRVAVFALPESIKETDKFFK